MLAQSMNILLVEDDQVDVMNVKRAFKKCNISNRLYVANNGLEALDMLNGVNGEKIDPLPGIVLLDINMPKMNGLEFLHEIRSDDRLKQLNVFVMTTSNEQKDKDMAHRYNVAGYIVKPLDFGQFQEAIQVLNAYWALIELPAHK